MVTGFRDFISRGNVADLAVGVVIGAAFGGVVTAFTSGFITALIRATTGSGVKVGGQFVVNGATFDDGLFISALLNFLIVAAMIYFLVAAPVNHLNDRLKRKDLPPVAEPGNEEKLLAEIRDALRASGQGATRTAGDVPWIRNGGPGRGRSVDAHTAYGRCWPPAFRKAGRPDAQAAGNRHQHRRGHSGLQQSRGQPLQDDRHLQDQHPAALTYRHHPQDRSGVGDAE